MTELLERPAPAPEVRRPSTPAAPPSAPAPPAPDEASEVRPGRVLVTALLATSAAAWIAGGVFVEVWARGLAVVAGAAGVGGVALALRSGRTWLQYLLAPGAFVLGYVAALVLPNATGITGTVPELVRSAVRNGGLAEPPIPLDPGWRFLVVTLLVFVGAASASLATGLGKPRLAALVPLPVVLAGAINQPDGRELISGGLALVLLVGALMVSFTAELAEEASGEGLSRTFELRQLGRGALAMLAVVAVLVGLSQASLLFPVPEDEAAAKPQRPQVQPLKAVKDRPLFTVSSQLRGPWRFGVLDEYDGSAWLLPPYDPDRVVDADALGSTGGTPVEATFSIKDLGGFTLPAPANPQRISGARGDVGFDPRTQVFRTRKGAAGEGFTYTVAAPQPATGAQLKAAAAGPPPGDVQRFAEVPEPPVQVVDLLATAPTNPWERLQAVRARLYTKVVAAGSGVPTDVNPARVVQLLNGDEATPYEIVAAEALLARWAGLPARIGYGFNGGEKAGDAVEFRPRHGANWLEVWFAGHGWVPVLGTPPKARSSLTTDPKNTAPTIKPSDDLSLQVYLPVLNPNPLQFFQVVRYWLARAIPLALLLGLVIAAIPYPVKLYRRRRRRQWAAGHGLGGRIAVAYAEFRDHATDLGVGDSSTPIDFLNRVVDDDEHAELAWLVTRALWGDLARDLREDDAVAAEQLSASLRRRLAGAQPVLPRVQAASSRASLRAPYDAGLPNPWPSRRLPRPDLARLAARPLRRLTRLRPA